MLKLPDDPVISLCSDTDKQDKQGRSSSGIDTDLQVVIGAVELDALKVLQVEIHLVVSVISVSAVDITSEENDDAVFQMSSLISKRIRRKRHHFSR